MRETNRRLVLAFSCTALFTCGFLGSFIGPVLPDLAARAHSDLASLGSIFTALFLGSLFSQMAAGAAGDRFGQKPVLIAGLLVVSLGALGISVSQSLPLMLAAALFTGIGNGFLVVGANLIITDVFTERSVMALNMANTFYGVGSVSGPALVSVMLGVLGTALPTLYVAAVVALVPVAIGSRLWLPRPARVPIVRDAPTKGIYSSPLLWALGLLLLLYVGVEIGTGGWLVTYMNKSTGLSRDTGSLLTSAYWLALTVGRVLGAAVSPRLGALNLLLTTIGCGLLGALIMLASTGNVAVSMAGVLLLGLSLAPIYPTTVAYVASLFPAGPGKAGGAAMTLGSVGGSTLPWLLGLLILQVSPRAGAALVAGAMLSILGLCVLSAFLAGHFRRTSSVSAT